MYFGYVADVQTGAKRAFFSNSEDVFVLGVGDLLMGRFRLIQFGSTNAELEEIASGRHATVQLEDAGRS